LNHQAGTTAGTREGAAPEKVERESTCLQTHQLRLDQATEKRKGEPLASGAMESTCRQYQGRFKLTGQFWSQAGDETLMSLETFRRNGRCQILFPHTRSLAPSKN